jgi:hypothetical protein
MSENITLRFQLNEDEDSEVWEAKNQEIHAALYVRNNRIVRIDITGFELSFLPACEEGAECVCYFPDDDENAEMDCPWGQTEETFVSSGSYDTDLPFDRQITLEDINKEISNTCRPEFMAPASIVDLLSFTWIIMDADNGIRTLLEGGQINRPAQDENP